MSRAIFLLGRTLLARHASVRRMGVRPGRRRQEALDERAEAIRLSAAWVYASRALRLAGLASELIAEKLRGSPSCASWLVEEAASMVGVLVAMGFDRDGWKLDAAEAQLQLDKALAHTRGPTLDFATVPLRSVMASLVAVRDEIARVLPFRGLA